MIIQEPGFSADDPQDGDLSSDVNVTSNVDYSKEGDYVVEYFVKDSDGHSATQKREIIISSTKPTSWEYKDYEVGGFYYLPSYIYDTRAFIGDESITNSTFVYDSSKNRVVSEDYNIVYKKSGGFIYKTYLDKTYHDRVSLDDIRSYNSDDELVSKFPLKLKIDNEYIDDDNLCHIAEHIDSFVTDTKTKELSDAKKFLYEDVLRVECSKNGKKTDIYYAKDRGEILRVSDDRIYLVEVGL
jgi:hypothetical protein